jgi:hypothetical protein
MAIPPPPPPAAPPPPPPPPPAKSGNRTLIIVLCILGAILIIIGGCVSTCAYFGWKASKKAREYSLVAQRNPQFAAISLAASLHPDIQIVSKDEAAGKITLRNKKTGEVVTLDLNNYSSANIGKTMEQFAKGMKPAPTHSGAMAEGESEPAPSVSEEQPAEPRPVEKKISPARAAAQSAVMKKFPDCVPTYRGARTLDATLNTFAGNTVGNYAFATGDAPETVADFYEKKFTAAGFTILTRGNGSNDNGSTVSLIAQHTDPQISISFAAGIDNGKTRVDIGFTQVGSQ